MKFFNDITDADKEAVIKMYKDAKVSPSKNKHTIQSIIKELDIYEHTIRSILKKADIYVSSPIPEYEDLETATKNYKPTKYDGYTDVRFRGTVRVFGETDAWCDSYMNDWDASYPALLGEALVEYQVRMDLLRNLDVDLNQGSEDRSPYYRPFNIQTTKRS